MIDRCAPGIEARCFLVRDCVACDHLHIFPLQIQTFDYPYFDLRASPRRMIHCRWWSPQGANTHYTWIFLGMAAPAVETRGFAPDLFIANDTLYQLSYAPGCFFGLTHTTKVKFKVVKPFISLLTPRM